MPCLHAIGNPRPPKNRSLALLENYPEAPAIKIRLYKTRALRAGPSSLLNPLRLESVFVIILASIVYVGDSFRQVLNIQKLNESVST